MLLGVIVYPFVLYFLQCRLSSDNETCNALYVPAELPNIVGQSVIFAICLTLLLCVYNEHSFKKRPWLLYVYSFFMVITLEAIDVVLVIWQSKPSNGDSIINPTHPQTSKVDIKIIYSHKKNGTYLINILI